MLGVVGMGVDSFRRGDRGMPKELLDVLHRDSSMPEHRRAGMPQVMEFDHSEIVLLEDIHLIRHTKVFSPSHVSGTMTSADSLYIVVTRLLHPYKVSWDKPLFFPRLPSQFNH